MLAGTGRAGDEPLGEMPPNYGRLTVEKAAIKAVLAWCRPEYLPVVVPRRDLDVHVRPSRALHLMRKRAHDRHSMWVADCRPPHRPSPCSPAMRRMESRIIRAEPPASSADRWAGRWPASGTASTSRCTPIRCWSWARNTLGRSPTAHRRRTISRHLYETVRRPYRTRLPDADHGEGTNLRFGKGETRREPDAMISKFPSAEERSTSWRPAEPPAIFQWRRLVGSARRTVRVRSRGRCNKFD